MIKMILIRKWILGKKKGVINWERWKKYYYNSQDFLKECIKDENILGNN